MATSALTRYTTSGRGSDVRSKIGLFRLRAILATTLAAILALIFIWPFLCIVGSTFNKIDAVMNPLTPIPAKFSTQFYQLMVSEKYHFQNYVVNSVWIAVATTVLSTLACTLSGYALAKLRFPGRDVLFSIIIGIMLLPTATMLVPQFIVMRDLKLIDNYWGLILPGVGGGAFGIFLMRQFMLGIPTEMMEAARMDGANEFDLFFRIVLPNAKAGIGVIATLSLRGTWNALLWPQIIISDVNKRLLMPAIANLNQQQVADVFALPVVRTAAIVAALVPLALYAYSQKYFVSTLAGAIKG
ncbi:MAG TPA: carbohydrate ABC transporter permease [Anaerolineae bacterium]|nr:carbohydrate ABC transporter permease [Anaerolineae bacterium]HQI84677.1 carbohydrate ABC transporter permease [Anaerolineae bacterium]